MNAIKKFAGIVWILIAPIAMYLLMKTALAEIEAKPGIDTIIQWGVFIIIFLPIAAGLVIFGWYALKGEYAHLPHNSNELDED